MEADEERIKLEALAEMLALETDDASQEYLMQVGRSLLECSLLHSSAYFHIRCMNVSTILELIQLSREQHIC